MEKEPDYFNLDIYDLHGEWKRQPKLYHDAAIELADARRDYEIAKADEKLVYAEIDEQVRREPMSFGIEKITEAVVERTIERHDTYRQAHLRVIDAKHLVDVKEASVETLQHRKKALEGLVQLQIADFYAEPKLPAEGKKRQEAKLNKDVFGGKKVGQ